MTTTQKKYPDVPELVALQDMPEMFGYSLQYFYQMRTNDDMLEPDGTVGRTPYWIKARVADWWAERPDRSK